MSVLRTCDQVGPAEDDMKRRTVKADEWDVVTNWRRYICYMQRAGVTSAIKRRMRRRERHDAKSEIRCGDPS